MKCACKKGRGGGGGWVGGGDGCDKQVNMSLMSGIFTDGVMGNCSLSL